MEELPDSERIVILKEDSMLNQHIIDRLDELFKLCPPESLHKSVNYVFFQYLYHARDHYPEDFKYIAEDFYFLMEFLRGE